MRGRWLTNLILALVAALLGTTVFFEINRQDAPTRLTGLAPDTIGRITLERKARASVRLQRTPDGWQMTDPFQVEADAQRIGELLGILGAPVRRSFPMAAASASELGLDPPAIRLLLDDIELSIGGIEPIEQRRYVAIGDLVHLIDDRFYHHLIARDLDYISAKILPTGFKADSGIINGVPLTAESLAGIQTLSAERVEPLSGETAGGLLQLLSPGGERLRFLITEGGNRWSRLDLRLSYLVPSAPLLVTDPTKPAVVTETSESMAAEDESEMMDVPPAPYIETLGPDSDTGAPIPVVKKGPERTGGLTSDDAFPPDLRLLQQDPFAPDPAMEQEEPYAEDPPMQKQSPYVEDPPMQQEEPYAVDPATVQQDPFAPDPAMEEQPDLIVPAPAIPQQDPFAPDPAM